MVTKSNDTQEVSDYGRLFGHQVSGPRREVSDGPCLGLTSASLHFSPYTFGGKLVDFFFFLSYAQHSQRFFIPGGRAGVLAN